MFSYWAVEAVGDDVENDGQTHQLGVFVARDEAEAAHVALLNVPFEPLGTWEIVAHRVHTHAALSFDA